MAKHERHFGDGYGTSIRGASVHAPSVARGDKRLTCGVHPAVIRIAMGATAAGLLGISLTFGEPGFDSLTVGVILFALMFFGIFLMPVAAYTLNDPRWRQRHSSLSGFLNSDVPIDSGVMQGRHVLLQIILLPVALAFAFTAIGLIVRSFG